MESAAKAVAAAETNGKTTSIWLQRNSIVFASTSMPPSAALMAADAIFSMSGVILPIALLTDREMSEKLFMIVLPSDSIALPSLYPTSCFANAVMSFKPAFPASGTNFSNALTRDLPTFTAAVESLRAFLDRCV